MKNREIKVLLSAPRGFCAGVERAIEIVQKSIKKSIKKVFFIRGFWIKHKDIKLLIILNVYVKHTACFYIII